MIKKNIFNKKRYIKFNFFIFFFIFLILFFLLMYYFLLNKNKYYIIPSYKNSFYYIPDEKGGKKIINQDKKGLHLSYKDSNEINFNNDAFLDYSIQIMSNYDYNIITNKRNELINIKDSIFLNKDLYLGIFKNNIANEYLLLYKNFVTRELALDYCNKYVFFVDNCIIVNVKQLD